MIATNGPKQFHSFCHLPDQWRRKCHSGHNCNTHKESSKHSLLRNIQRREILKGGEMWGFKMLGSTYNRVKSMMDHRINLTPKKEIKAFKIIN